MDIHVYRAGQDILREGEASSCFFVVLSGQVRIIHKGQKIRLLKAQDVFGLECVLLNKPSPYSATAISKSRIASYGSDALDHFLRDNPRITQSILISTLYQLKQTSHNLSGESDSFTIEDVRIRFFRDGEVIIEEGATARDFYRLVSTQGGLRVAIRRQGSGSNREARGILRSDGRSLESSSQGNRDQRRGKCPRDLQS